jgi:hypothetical protein
MCYDPQHSDTQHIDNLHNGTQPNDNKPNDTQHNDTQYNDTKHNDTQHSDSKLVKRYHLRATNEPTVVNVVLLTVDMLSVAAPSWIEENPAVAGN